MKPNPLETFARLAKAATTRAGQAIDILAPWSSALLSGHISPAKARLQDQLHQAIAEKCTDDVLKTLESGADPNKADRNGRTPLACAATLDALECARILLDRGARADAPSREVWLHPAPLGIAAKHASPDFVLLLLTRGARCDAPDSGDDHAWQPTHVAASEGKTESLRALLAHGADPNSSTDEGMTPLHLACQAGQLDCARLLLQSGARFDALDHGARQPSYYVLNTGKFADKLNGPALLAELLRSGADPNWIWPNSNGSFFQRDRSLPMLAAGANDIACMDILERFGADMDAKNSLGHDAHLVAKQRRHADASAWFAARAQRKALAAELGREDSRENTQAPQRRL